MGPIGSVGLLAMPLLVAGAPVHGKPESYAPVTMLIMAALPERLRAEGLTAP